MFNLAAYLYASVQNATKPNITTPIVKKIFPEKKEINSETWSTFGILFLIIGSIINLQVEYKLNETIHLSKQGFLIKYFKNVLLEIVSLYFYENLIRLDECLGSLELIHRRGKEKYSWPGVREGERGVKFAVTKPLLKQSDIRYKN